MTITTVKDEIPLNVYAYSKSLFDKLVRSRLSGCRSQVVGLRYFNVYGPREAHKRRMASIVYQLFQQFKNLGTIRLFEGTGKFPDGEQRRESYVTYLLRRLSGFDYQDLGEKWVRGG